MDMWFLIAAGVVVAALIIWTIVSFSLQRHHLPSECVIRAAQEREWKEFGFSPDLERLERTYASINGRCLFLDVLESGHGKPTVVFMPGTAVYAELQLQFLYALNDRGFNVVGFDPRGHGRSSGLRGTFTVTQLVDDAIGVIQWSRERFGGPVGMSGSSQGGVVSFYVAATDGAADSVMCHNLAVLDGKGNVALSTLKIPRFLVPFVTRLFRMLPFLVLPVTWYLPFNKLKLKNGESAVKLLESDPLAVLAYDLRALGTLSITPLPTPVEKIKTPVMLLASTGDEVFPQTYVLPIFERLQCKKHLVNLQGLPHLLLQEYVDQVIGPISDWFSETLAPRQTVGSK